ncbi:neuropeptide CCHamide-2 receptor-like [Ctenocephalides felis]|uniref:neuropeptide CCHamide-2 receptor-like n=1 Tax=Ctenocephalides felis TaxID=7515 RepID=UPI000E6E15F3|nr:neuropeptide CCHamide-2 receptor-like [Ctenocephalides felis]
MINNDLYTTNTATLLRPTATMLWPTVTLIYILSLALADLLVILTSVPFTSIVYTLPSWPWGGAVCRLSEFVRDLSIGVSVFTLTALSADRYCAIVNPLRNLQTRPMTVVMATFIWLLAVLLALPAAVISDTVDIVLNNVTNHTICVCSPFPQGPYEEIYAKYNVVTKAMIYYVVPLAVIAVLYILMARRLQQAARQMPGELAGPQSRAQARARRHVARMVLVFVLVFIICFLPHHVFMLWFHLNPNSREEFDSWWHALRIVGFCLGFINSCVNPVALYCVSGVFRQHYHRYLCCGKRVSPAVALHSSLGGGSRSRSRSASRFGRANSTAVCDTSFMNSTMRR